MDLPHPHLHLSIPNRWVVKVFSCPSEALLLADAQPFGERQVSLKFGVAQVCQQAAPLAYHFEQAAA